MKELGDRLARLDGLPPATVGLILRHAFAAAEPAEATALSVAMIRHRVELPLVITRLDRLDRSVRDRLSDPAFPLADSLADAMSGDDQAKRNAIELIRLRSTPTEAALLLPTLGATDHRNDGIGAAAATVLLELVQTPFRSEPGEEPAAPGRTTLGEIIGTATLRGDGVHHQELLLAGLLLTERDEATLNDWLDRLDDLSRMALRGVVGRTELPTVRRHLLRWLGRSALRQQVARRWHQATESGPAAISDLLEDGHLLRTPSRAKALRLADRPVRCLPDPIVANSLPERLQGFLPDLLGSVGLTHRSRIERLAGGHALPSAVARLRSLLALRSFDRPDAAAAAISYLRDRDRSVARTAFQVLYGWPVARSSPELLDALAREAPSDLAIQASMARASLQPAFFFAAAPLLDPPALACAAWRLSARMGRSFVPPLREAIVAGPLAQRRAAVQTARRLHLEPAVVDALLRASSDADPILASAAAAALGATGAPTASRQLARLAEHADARVRANAIEALAVAGEPGFPLVQTGATDPVSRPRANAIAALLRRSRGEGVEQLRSMLSDPRADHRLSGLWVARRHRVAELADAIRGLSHDDPEPRLAARAAAVATLFDETQAPTRRRSIEAAA